MNNVTKVRIQKRMALLVRTEESIERISETVGYGTGFALSKAFKRTAGVSSQHYRLAGNRMISIQLVHRLSPPAS